MAGLNFAMKLLVDLVFLCSVLHLTQASAKPTVGFTSISSRYSESPTRLIYIFFERTGKTDISTTVKIEVTGTANFATDYSLKRVNGDRVVFPANSTANESLSILLFDNQQLDTVHPRTIILTIKPDATIIRKSGFSTHTVTIEDDEAPTVGFTSTSSRYSESSGLINIYLERTGGKTDISTTVTIEYNGTATYSDDYSIPRGSSNIVTFPANDPANKTFGIMLENNENVDTVDPRTIILTIKPGATINIKSGFSTHTVTIEDDDAPAKPTVGFTSNSSSCFKSYRIIDIYLERTGKTDVGTYATIDLTGTATSFVDYILLGSRGVSFPANDPNQKSLRFALINTPRDDTVDPRTIILTIREVATIIRKSGFSTHTVTIKDDDVSAKPTVGFASISSSYSESSGLINILLERTNKTDISTTVTIDLSGTATKDSDYMVASSLVVTFPADSTNKTISLFIINDRIVEMGKSENITLTIREGSTINRKSGFSSHTVSIQDDDVAINCQDSQVNEKVGNAGVRISRTGSEEALNASHSIVCFTKNGTASNGREYIEKISIIPFVNPYNVQKMVIEIINDMVVKENSKFDVTCTSDNAEVQVQSTCKDAVVTIENDDAEVFICPGATTNVLENAGSYSVEICRRGVLSSSINIRLCTTINNINRRLAPSIETGCKDLTFAVNKTKTTGSFNISDDNIGEKENQTFQIYLEKSPPPVIVNETSLYVTIQDDDNTFCFTRTSVTVYEEHDKFVNFTIRRTGKVTTSNASVIINTSPQTANTPEDYTDPFLNHRLTFFTGEIEKNISVNIVNDKLVEDDETFQISLTGVDGSTVLPVCNTSTVTIVSNDVNILCRNRSGPQSVYENEGPVLMEFTREGSLQYKHTMEIRTYNGTATSGNDYTSINKTLAFAPNQENKTETVVLINDNVQEPDEAFRLSVTSSDDRVNMMCTGTNFIIRNDDVFIGCANQSIEANEGNKIVYFTLKREGGSNKSSSFWFSTKDGTAFDKSDYMPQMKVNRTFLPGQVYMTLSVDLVDDEYNEDDETFSVIIGSHVPTTTSTSGRNCTLITIKDNDPSKDEMTEQQAQALLDKRQNLQIIIVVAFAILALVALVVIIVFCYLIRK